MLTPQEWKPSDVPTLLRRDRVLTPGQPQPLPRRNSGFSLPGRGGAAAAGGSLGEELGAAADGFVEVGDGLLIAPQALAHEAAVEMHVGAVGQLVDEPGAEAFGLVIDAGLRLSAQPGERGGVGQL